jgi:hypothetical protein
MAHQDRAGLRYDTRIGAKSTFSHISCQHSHAATQCDA